MNHKGKFDEGLIQQTLLSDLRSILDQYPNDGQILKELIQNADDGGARRVAFLYDKSSHGTASLLDSGLSQYQGPALYAYNDAVFSEEDWTGIRMLHNSVKLNDKMKVGRFGLGFKSVFHITDMPGLLSGDGLAFIEPHEEYFTYTDGRGRPRPTSCKRWELREVAQLYTDRLRDQFSPFLLPEFGASPDKLAKGHYPGTIFRFPLRTASNMSQLSQVVYSESKVRSLISSLAVAPEMSLLFLKHVEKIEVYEREGQCCPSQLLLSISLSDKSLGGVRQQRQQFLDKVNRSYQGHPDSSSPLIATYPVVIVTRNKDERRLETEWRVTHYCGGGPEIQHQLDTTFADVTHIPWVSTAFQVISDLPEKPQGHVFCSLPLPLQVRSPTGLRTHISGYFALAQNRRQLKWAAADADPEKVTDLDVLWNMFLLREVASAALVETVRGAMREGLPPGLVYSLVPDPASVMPEYAPLLEKLYQTLLVGPVVHTSAAGGRWLSLEEAVFDTPELRADLSGVLAAVLLHGWISLVTPPAHVRQVAVHRSGTALRSAIPSMARDVLRAHPRYFRGLSAPARDTVLGFLLTDSDYRHLVGIQELLPLADGAFTKFSPPSDAPVYLAPSEVVGLFPGAGRWFLQAATLSENVLGLLEKVAATKRTNLHLYTSDTFPALLRDYLSGKEGQAMTSAGRKHSDGSSSKFLSFLSSIFPGGGSKDDASRWAEPVWGYISHHFPSSLSRFEGLALVPAGPGGLVMLSRSHPVMLESDPGYGESLPPVVSALLSKTGVTVLSTLPTHTQIHTYVSRPCPAGVLRCLEMADSRKVKPSFSLLGDDELATLRQYFSEGVGSLGNQPLLGQLPLFHLLGSKSHCAAADVHQMAPHSSAPYPVFQDVAAKTDRWAATLGVYLGMQRMSEAQFLSDVILPDVLSGRYTPEQVSLIMVEAMDNFYLLIQQDATLPDCMATVTFLQTQSGHVHRPCDVYDPTDPVLVALFSEVGHLPCNNMSHGEAVAKLKRIGLKTQNDVTIDDVTQVAEYVARKGKEAHDPAPLVSRAHTLVAFLSTNKEQLMNGTLTTLTELPWLPVTRAPPTDYPGGLEWAGRRRSFDSPIDMTAMNYTSLMGSVAIFPDVPLEHLTTVENHLVTRRPTVHDVIAHFRLLTDGTIAAEDRVVVGSMTAKIYRALQSHQDGAGLLEDVTHPVWVGDMFVTPSAAVLNQPPFDLRPHMFTIPQEVSPYRQLLADVGVLCAAEVDFTNLLHTIAKHHVTGTDLSCQWRDLTLAVNILNHLAGLSDQLTPQLPVYVPIQGSGGGLQMALSDQVCFGDIENIDVDDVTSEDGREMHILHPNVPHQTARRLGLPHVAHVRLRPDELELGEAYGQGESLTERLKGLLEQYSDGLAVLKELIQNADDAGATEVRFLYDERENADHRRALYDPGMADLQGPALLAFNDAAFSDSDFRNIIKLGGATKQEDTEKVGRFGLGFNAVYNVTDVPCFYSNGQFVVLDPHLHHLGNARRGQGTPGIKVDIRQKGMHHVQQYADQYHPIEGIFGCRMSLDAAHFQGTLFRLPLRTEKQAGESEICSHHYSRDELLELLRLLVESGDCLLLFLQNVKSVSVHHLPNGAKTEDMELLYKVTLDPGHKGPRGKGFLTLAKGHMRVMTYAHCSASLQSCVTATVRQEVTTRGLELLGRELHPTTDQDWLVCQAFGTGAAYKMAVQESGAQHLLPVGGVAVPLARSTPSFGLPSALANGRLFCFLPLPSTDTTLLPVHVNGYFSVSSDRRHLYEQDVGDKRDPKAAWNSAVMTDAVTSAYVSMLRHVTKMVDMTIEPQDDYYRLWPVHIKAGLIGELSVSFLQWVFSHPNIKLFLGPGGWYSLQQAIFPTRDITNSPICFVLQKAVNQILLSTEKRFIILPESILEAMEFSSPTQITEKVIDMAGVYREIVLTHLPLLSHTHRDRLLLYALTEDLSLHELLTNKSCIPVTPDGSQLKMPCELVHPHSALLRNLYTPEDARFPHFPNVTSQVTLYSQLGQLGMRYDDLSWAEIAERAASVEGLPQDKMAARTSALVGLLNRKLGCETLVHGTPQAVSIPEVEREHIAAARFLPVCPAPPGYPLPWAGDVCEVVASPSSVHAAIHTELLGSVAPIVHQAALLYDWTPVANALGCVTLPTFDLVLCHLKNAIDAAADTHSVNVPGLQILTRTFEAAHAWLTEQVKVGQLSESQVVTLRDTRLVYAGSQLYAPGDCCTQGTDCPPYFICLSPNAERNHRELWSALHVLDHMPPANLVAYLQAVPPDDVTSGVKLCKLLSAALGREGLMGPEGCGMVYAPGQDGRMHPAAELCFNNCPWVAEPVGRGFCSPELTFLEAERVGVRTVRSAILEGHSSGLGDPFGQSEPLTQRIKRLLTGYPLGKGLVYELLQNADDAGATEVHFVVDRRHHPAEHVFEEGWRHLQGPALCVYNNRPFSQEDINGIQRLGTGSKVTNPTKTGQYGVGFNSMYHVTDTPTVLTDVTRQGQTLCAFDPHCRYVPHATRQAPGRRFTDIQDLQQQFPDVFGPYLPDLFPSLKSATLFRFPLRTAEQAAVSEISRDEVSPDTVEDMLQQFQEEGSRALLFLTHITSVRVTVYPAHGPPEEIHNIRVQLSFRDEARRRGLGSLLAAVGQDVREGRMVEVAPKTVSYTLTLQNGEETQDWLVVHTLGGLDAEEIDTALLEAFRRREICLLPRGGVAVPLSGPLKEGGTLFSTLPLPQASHVPVHLNGHFALSYENRDHLAESMKGGVHAAWNSLLFQRLICRAYVTLLEIRRDTVALGGLTKYTQLFPRKEEFGRDPYTKMLLQAFYSHLMENGVSCLPVVGVSAIDDRLLWYPPLSDDFHQQAYFNTLSSQYKEVNTSPLSQLLSWARAQEMDPTNKRVERVLRGLGVPLVACPLVVKSAFAAAEVTLPEISPEVVLTFLKRHQDPDSMCTVQEVDVGVEDTMWGDLENVDLVLSYCMRTEATPDLEGAPLLVTEGTTLRRFSASHPVFLSDHAALLSEHPELFLHRRLCHHLTSLLHAPPELPPVVRELSLERFTPLLAELLPPCMFSGQIELERARLQEVLDGGDQQWLTMLWDYLLWQVRARLGEGYTRADGRSCLSALQPVLGWNLLPVTRGRQRLLLQVRDVDAVLDLHQGDTLSQGLRDALRTLGLLALDIPWGITSMDMFTFLHKLQGNIDRPLSVLRALGWAEDAREGLTGPLSPRRAAVILGYLARKLEEVKGTPGCIETLQALPIYPTKCGGLSGVHTHLGSCYMVPATIPDTDMDVFTSHHVALFLRTPEDEGAHALYTYIGVTDMPDAEFYTTFCLVSPHFQEMMTDAGRLAHLSYLRQRLAGDDPPPTALVDCLQRIPLVRDADGDFCQVNDFFDRSEPIFELMEEKMLPAPYNSEEWNEFMRTCGMVFKVTPAMYLAYVTHVAQAAAKHHEDRRLPHVALTLIQHLFRGYFRRDYHNNLIYDIRDIPFVPAHTAEGMYQKVCPQHGGGAPFVAFHGACAPGLTGEAWAVCPLVREDALPQTHHLDNYRHAQQQQGKLMDKLGVFSTTPPRTLTPELLVNNLIAVCSHLARQSYSHKDPLVSDIQDVIGAIFRAVSRDFRSYSAPLMSRIRGAEVVAVDDWTRFVRAGNTSEELQKAIGHYVYPIPNDLRPFCDLLKALGASDHVTVPQYVGVLTDIYNKAGDGVLDQNEKKAIQKAISGLYNITRLKVRCKGDGHPLQDVRTLPLPSVQSRSTCKKTGRETLHTCLRPSTELVLDDKFGGVPFITGLNRPLLHQWSDIDISPTAFACDARSFADALPPSLRPMSLSALLTETLEDAGEATPHSVAADSLRFRFRMDAFPSLLERLAVHRARLRKTNADLHEAALECCRGLRALRIHAHHHLVTISHDSGKVVEGCRGQVPFFLRVSPFGDDAAGLELLMSDTMPLGRHSASLHRALARHFPLLAACTPPHVHDLLDPGKPLPELHARLDEEGGYELAGAGSQFVERLGRCVPREQHYLIDHGLRHLPQDAYLALQVDDPLDRGEDGEPAYIYVKLVDELDPEDASGEREDGDTSEEGEDGDAREEEEEENVREEGEDGYDRDESEDENKDDGDRGVGEGHAIHAIYRVMTDEQGGFADVGRDKLYEFVRYTVEEGRLISRDGVLAQTGYGDVVLDIRYVLRFALSLPPAQAERRNRLVKRLCLRWHLDGVAEPSRLMEQVAAYLEEALATDDGPDAGPLSLAAPHDPLSLVGASYYAPSGSLAHYLASRATEHRGHREEYERNLTQEMASHPEDQRSAYVGRSGCRGRDPGGRGCLTENPQPGMARLWLAQAEHDLRAVASDMGDPPAHDWACLKALQCAKLSLTAVMHLVNSDLVERDMSVRELRSRLSARLPDDLGAALDSLLPAQLRLPLMEPGAYGQTAHRRVDEDTAGRMREAAARVLVWAQATITARVTDDTAE